MDETRLSSFVRNLISVAYQLHAKMLFTESLIKDFIGITIAVFIAVITYIRWRHQYWKKKNLPYIQPSIPFGNLGNPLYNRENFGITMYKIYKEMKKNNWRHGGIFMLTRPTYFVIDPDYIKNVMTKDFHHFVDRGFYYNEKDDPLSAHLFALGGNKWRNLRTKLTPTFTSGKMKMMFPTIVECEAGLHKRVEEAIVTDGSIDIKEILACFTTDVIGSCAFGLDCHTTEGSPFRFHGQKILQASGFELLKRLIALNMPEVGRALHITVTPKDVSDFFMKMVTDTVNYREKNNVARKDFMQLLIDLKNNPVAEEEGHQHDGKSLTLEEIAAQSVVFFVAGFETSSTTMAFALYELAKNPEVQEKLRNEVETVLAKYDNKITYEAIQDMKYMDQVIDETLRKYPPVSFLTRECVKDYKIPDEDVIIETGTTIMIPILGLHYDEEYYPDPQRFNPDRFSEENKNSRHRYVSIPFGEGPRMCIGMRFGIMQSKVGLTALLRNFKFTVNEKTQEPLQFKPDSFVLAAVGEIWLDAQKV